MTAAVLTVALALGAGAAGGTGASAADALPDGPGQAMLREKCLGCHGADYVTQQRLTVAQWQRTVDKMRKFGAHLTDDEARVLSEYLAHGWPASTPDRPPAPVTAPAGALPRR